MEKFAIDLDKVLDDFEFNEDCAEQITSVTTSVTNISVNHDKHATIESVPSKTCNYFAVKPEEIDPGIDILPSFEKNKNPQNSDISSTCSLAEKSIVSDTLSDRKESMLESKDPINNFYTHDSVIDKKLGQKSCISPCHSDQMSSMAYNDISRNLLQKQHNEYTSSKDNNKYDKKLNQPNIKPSISNVFNSLNEYINAPTGNLDYVDVLHETDDMYKISTDNSSEQNSNFNAMNVMVNEYSSPSLKETRKTLDCENVLTRGLDEVPEVKIGKEEDEEEEEEENADNDDDDDDDDDMIQNIILKSPTQIYSTESEGNNSKDIMFLTNRSNTANNAIVSIEISNTNLDNKITINDGTDISENIIDNQQQPQIDSTCDCTFSENKQNITESTAISDINVINTENHDQDIETTKKCDILTNTHISDTMDITDNFSEEELNQYLLELEEEARSEEESMLSENTLLTRDEMSKNDKEDIINQQNDEDKAPIFEKIRIEIPEMSEKEYQEKVRKFPIIDYGTNIFKQDVPHDSKTKKNLHEFDDNIETDNEKNNQLKDTHADENDQIEKNTNITEAIIQDTLTEVTSENIVHSTPNIIADEKVALKYENSDDQCNLNINMAEKLQQNVNTDLQLQHNNEAVFTDSVDKNENSDANKYHNTDNSKGTSFVLHDNSNKNYKAECITNITDACTTSHEDNNQEIGKPIRPQTLDIATTHNKNESHILESSNVTSGELEHSENGGVVEEDRGALSDISDNSLLECSTILGKQPPFWIPDSNAPGCMICDIRFTMFKRRHHCRACGKVLCNKCCNMKYRLEYQGNIDSRVCVPCFHLLTKAENEQGIDDWPTGYISYAGCSDINSPQGRQPNPNNPMEYCSTIPPLQQLAGGLPPPPTVMVPVGVLKREGSKHRTEGSKSVMFSDGIRPGCDLTELDTCWDLKPASYRRQGNKRATTSGSALIDAGGRRQGHPLLDNITNSYVPHDSNLLPPTVTVHKGQITYHPPIDESILYKTLKNECETPVMFAINRNLYVYVKITNLNCCVNKICWNITSKGLACVGQDEVILLVEILPDETRIPKDLLIYINQLYLEAIKGNTVTELGFSVYQDGNLLGSREHTGFLFIRQTLQCLQKIVLPPAPFLIGLLIHRWETPWAKVFPLRLLLRLGAEYRYYPCPLVSVRFRDALYFEIGHTVMKVLADFRNFGYTLPGVRGLTIHLKNRTTDVMFPKNRYDQVIKGLNNSNDHVLAYASNFSIAADSHLVCIQTSNTGDESNYQTQAINIHNKPRTVTGASFLVINGALKSSMGLSAKSSIVEDGLMVEIMPEKMEALKTALKNMQDFSIGCGRQGASEPDETVNIKWVDNDVLFNLGVKSPIDGQLMDGIPSIRVHNGIDYRGATRFIRWTEVFIIKSDDHSNGINDPVDINKLSGNIAKATCAALVKLLDLLTTAGLTKLAVRATIHPDNVGYEAGSENTKLPPIYMNSLDNELIQVLHIAAQSSQDAHTVLELIFYILDD